MIFAANEKVGGLPAKMARDFLKEARYSGISGADIVADFCKIPMQKAQEFLDYCLDKKWLTAGANAGAYAITNLGAHAGAARIGKVISRAKAEQLVADVTQRAQEWNDIPDVPVFVSEIKVVGPYVSDEQTLDTIYFALRFDRRPEHANMEFEATRVLVEKLTKRQGWAMPRDFLEILGFFEEGARRYLKARQPAVRLVLERDLVPNCASESIFKAVS